MIITANNILACTAQELLEHVAPFIGGDVPAKPIAADVNAALAKYSNNYAHLSELFIDVRLAVRVVKGQAKNVKNNNADPSSPQLDLDVLMSKKDILEQAMEVVKHKWDTASRIWTVHHAEWTMTGGKMKTLGGRS